MAPSALIVAAGSGTRFGSKKQFLPLGGVSVLRRTADCFAAHALIARIVIVVPPGDLERAGKLLQGLATPWSLAPGGQTRQESVHNGLERLQPSEDEVVLIHDGVRPLVSAALITRIIEGLTGYDACIPGLPASDTLKEVRGDVVKATVPREELYHIQTPQAFHLRDILAAPTGTQAHPALTDDSALLEAQGARVRVVPGEPLNIKITYENDILIAEALLHVLESRNRI